MTVTIYHNPSCGTSRGALAIIREKGIEPTIIEYLKKPLTKDQLKALIAKMGVPVILAASVADSDDRVAESFPPTDQRKRGCIARSGNRRYRPRRGPAHGR